LVEAVKIERLAEIKKPANTIDIEGMVSQVWTYSRGEVSDVFVRLAVYDENTLETEREGNWGRKRRIAHYVNALFIEGKPLSAAEPVELRNRQKIRVRGELRAAPSSVPAVVTPPTTRGEALRLTAGWLAMLLTIGLIALVLASRNLDGIAHVLEQDFGKAFLVGVAGQLGFLPLLILTIVALCVTVLGILLVPFVLVAAPIAFGGLITLGWLAMALMLGHALLRGAARDDRAAMIRALVPGIVLLMAPWAIASLMQGTSTSALLVRTAAIGITWVAATAGLGGAILSRAGTGSSARTAAPIAPSSTGWQTPTPVAGIATARRPVPARPTATK
jgi:hypothetical protein